MIATGDSFISDVVMPAFSVIRKKLESKKRMAAADRETSEATIISTYHAQLEIRYTIGLETTAEGTFAVVSTTFRDPLTAETRRRSLKPSDSPGRNLPVFPR